MQTAQAIALVQPERRFDLTLVGDDWQTVRGRMKDLTRRVRERSRSWNVEWHVEPNPKGTGHHIHGTQWGEFVPFTTLRECAIRVGMGSRVRIERVTDADRASAYGLKHAAAAYSLKLARGQEESLLQYLDLNGGRMVHTSRGFWRDATAGLPLRGVRDAVALAMTREFGESDDWVLVNETEVGK